jgi:hypothetical protein
VLIRFGGGYFVVFVLGDGSVVLVFQFSVVGVGVLVTDLLLFKFCCISGFFVCLFLVVVRS